MVRVNRDNTATFRSESGEVKLTAAPLKRAAGLYVFLQEMTRNGVPRLIGVEKYDVPAGAAKTAVTFPVTRAARAAATGPLSLRWVLARNGTILAGDTVPFPYDQAARKRGILNRRKKRKA